MRVQEVMTGNPACCAADTNLREVAAMMVARDCGEIPIVQMPDNKPIGVVTDRDITCRAVAKGKNPLSLKARDVMTSPALTVTPDMSLEDCCRMLEQSQVRRILVVNNDGGCCGIISQADIAHWMPAQDTGALVKDLSRPVKTPSRNRS